MPRKFRARRTRIRRRPRRRNRRYGRRRMKIGRPVNASRNRPVGFVRNFDLAGVWVDIQASADQVGGLTMGVGGGSFAVDETRFVVTVTANSTCYLAIGYAFQLTHVPSVSEFSSLFDQYRVAGYAIRVICGSNSFAGQWQQTIVDDAPPGYTYGLGGSVNNPILHSVTDADDSVEPAASSAGVDALRERWNYKVKRFDGRNSVASRYVKPHLMVPVEIAAGTTSVGMNLSSRWIDMADTNVSNHGYKAVLEIYNPMAADCNLTFKILGKVYFQARGVH